MSIKAELMLYLWSDIFLCAAHRPTVPMRLTWFWKWRTTTRWSGWTLTQRLLLVKQDYWSVSWFFASLSLFKTEWRRLLLLIRKWWVGDQTQACQEGDQQTVHKGWSGVSGGDLLPHHPEKAPLLHHQHHCSVCALLLALPPGLLLTCQRSPSSYGQINNLWLFVIVPLCFLFCSGWPEVHHVHSNPPGSDRLPVAHS